MREVLWDPEKLQSYIDGENAGYAGRRRRKENPFPELRTSDGERRKAVVTRQASRTAEHPRGRRDVRAAWIYTIRCKTNTEKRNARRIDESDLDLALLMPRRGKKLLYPGVILVGLDHKMTGDEFHRLTALHAGVIDQEPLPREAADEIRALCPRKEAS